MVKVFKHLSSFLRRARSFDIKKVKGCTPAVVFNINRALSFFSVSGIFMPKCKELFANVS
jgi:hypothetical protein